jgi:DNA-binding NarL/FixJ family response regulator
VIEVVVVGAYPTIRTGLRALLSAEGDDYRVSGEAATFADAADLVARRPPTVVLADLGAAHPRDLIELGALAQEQPNLGLVVLIDPGEERGLPPLARGRLGLLPRDASAELIREAVRAVAAGLIALDPVAVPSLVSAPARPLADPSAEPLTTREREVLALLAQGLANKTIAQRLGISEHTVKFHVGAILTKLGAGSRTEAVTLAARQGLLML